MTILAIRGLTLSFGGVKALEGVTLDVPNGSIHAVIGPNGAGKTSLFNCLTGYYRPSAGTVVFRERDITRLSPPIVAAMGIRRTFQNLRVFPRLSLLENVIAGGHLRATASLPAILLASRGFRRDERLLREDAMDWLEFVGLAEEANRPAASVSYGTRKRMELARALMGEPSLLLLDEPAAGVSSVEREELSSVVRRVCEMGVTVLMIEHDVELVMQLASTIFVLQNGRMIAQGSPRQVREHPEVILAYMGRSRR